MKGSVYSISLLIPAFGQTPSIGISVLIPQGFQLFLSLPLTQFGRVGHPEEFGCEFNQPLRLDLYDLSHVLLCCHHQLMIQHPLGRESVSVVCLGHRERKRDRERQRERERKILPFRVLLEQCRGWMDVDRIAFSERLVAFLRILSCRMREIPSDNRLPYLQDII